MSEVFHASPLELLNSDDNEWLILMACAKVITEDREEQERDRDRNRP